jgi:hypothetical protein
MKKTPTKPRQKFSGSPLLISDIEKHFVLALVLAVTAETTEKRKAALNIVEKLASKLTPTQIQKGKKLAVMQLDNRYE